MDPCGVPLCATCNPDNSPFRTNRIKRLLSRFSTNLLILAGKHGPEVLYQYIGYNVIKHSRNIQENRY